MSKFQPRSSNAVVGCRGATEILFACWIGFACHDWALGSGSCLPCLVVHPGVGVEAPSSGWCGTPCDCCVCPPRTARRFWGRPRLCSDALRGAQFLFRWTWALSLPHLVSCFHPSGLRSLFLSFFPSFLSLFLFISCSCCFSLSLLFLLLLCCFSFLIGFFRSFFLLFFLLFFCTFSRSFILFVTHLRQGASGKRALPTPGLSPSLPLSLSGSPLSLSP